MTRDHTEHHVQMMDVQTLLIRSADLMNAMTVTRSIIHVLIVVMYRRLRLVIVLIVHINAYISNHCALNVSNVFLLIRLLLMEDVFHVKSTMQSMLPP